MMWTDEQYAQVATVAEQARRRADRAEAEVERLKHTIRNDLASRADERVIRLEDENERLREENASLHVEVERQKDAKAQARRLLDQRGADAADAEDEVAELRAALKREVEIANDNVNIQVALSEKLNERDGEVERLRGVLAIIHTAPKHAREYAAAGLAGATARDAALGREPTTED